MESTPLWQWVMAAFFMALPVASIIRTEMWARKKQRELEMRAAYADALIRGLGCTS